MRVFPVSLSCLLILAACSVDAESPVTGSVELVDQVVGLVSGDGRAYGLGFTALTAVDVATGAVAWTLDFTSQSVTNVSFADPVFAAGSVYLGGDPVRKIDGATGLVEATYSTGDSEMLGLAAADSAVYIGTRNGIFALTPDLVETWRHAPGEEVDRIAPTNVGVFYSQVGAGVGLVTRQGGPVWNDDDGGVYEALVATENLVLGARLQGTLEAWTPSDGVSAWTANETSSPVRGLAVSNSTVFFAGGGFVQGLDLTDGTVLWEWSPAMAPVGLSAL